MSPRSSNHSMSTREPTVSDRTLPNSPRTPKPTRTNQSFQGNQWVWVVAQVIGKTHTDASLRPASRTCASKESLRISCQRSSLISRRRTWMTTRDGSKKFLGNLSCPTWLSRASRTSRMKSLWRMEVLKARKEEVREALVTLKAALKT